MTVMELMEYLEDCDENAEVRLAIQPNYPFQHDVKTVIECDVEVRDKTERVVYIAEAGQNYDAPYLPGEASAELGWK